ncbi:hypothetical protein [Streptomyces sp. NPDC056144]|uniref:hypothetical protein n=1 Tax=unclassified Streptomyces TaxID=2593676 RepID=UPI0035E30829
MLADTVARLGGREPQILLQDHGQQRLVPLPGEGLAAGEPQAIDDSEAGRCFLTSRPVELVLSDGVRVLLPSMSVAAEIQWSLPPPLSMVTPPVTVAGVLEPAYDVAGDSFDYALNGDTFHLAMIDGVNRLEKADRQVRAVARDLSHTLKRARGEATSDDATLVMIEWRG